MIIIITIRSAHIEFEEAGIDDNTRVRNMAYESNIVIERLTRSPDAELAYFSPHSDWKLLEYSTESEVMDDGTLFSLNIRIKRPSNFQSECGEK
jgi:hypothetical protein